MRNDHDDDEGPHDWLATLPRPAGKGWHWDLLLRSWTRPFEVHVAEERGRRASACHVTPAQPIPNRASPTAAATNGPRVRTMMEGIVAYVFNPVACQRALEERTAFAKWRFEKATADPAAVHLRNERGKK